MTTNATLSPTRRTALIVGAVVVAAAVAGVLWFLGGEAPGTVDIGDASAQLGATTADTGSTTAAGTVDSVDGTWMVDTSVGEFSVEDTTGTFVGFRIEEELANVGATEAVGRTPQVSGSATIDDGTLTAAEFTADMSAIVSDEPRRDDRIQQALDTGAHTTATFALSGPVELGDVTAGEVVTVDAPGTMTIAGVTQNVTVPLQAVIEGGTAVVTSSFDIVFADYGVEVPTAPMVLSVEDHGDVELQLYLTPS